MKINSEYRLRNIAGENIVVRESGNDVNMTKVISLNPSSAWLWRELEEKDFDHASATDLLCGHYDVEREIAERDVERWILTLTEHNVIV